MNMSQIYLSRLRWRAAGRFQLESLPVNREIALGSVIESGSICVRGSAFACVGATVRAGGEP